ncbi:MAG: HAD hydrolase-like protein [Oscillospiraceae bacterium]
MGKFFNKKAILFDLDGTVIDSMEGIFNALYYMFDKVGVKVENSEGLQRFIGPSIGSTLMTHYSFEEKAAEDAVEIYREYYSTKGLLECTAYEGILELLKLLKLQGKKIALATKKPEVFSLKIIENLGLSKYFDAVCGASLKDNDNSKMAIIERAVKALGASKCDVVMVGDTKYDAIGSVDAGVDCIGVLYGFGEEDELTRNGAIKIAKDVSELTKILTEDE